MRTGPRPTARSCRPLTWALRKDLHPGAEHLRSFTVTAVLRDSRGRVHRWSARPDSRTGKPEARKATAQEVLDILDAPTSDSAVDALTLRRRDLLTGLLRAQLDGLGTTTERQRIRILARGDLGADLLATGDTEAFLACCGCTGSRTRTHCHRWRMQACGRTCHEGACDADTAFGVFTEAGRMAAGSRWVVRRQCRLTPRSLGWISYGVWRAGSPNLERL